jgi:hypothetical protein
MNETACVEFLVVNCGSSAVRERDGKIDIRFRPAMLTRAALDGLVYLLHERHWRRAVAAMHIGDGWRHEVLPHRREAAIDRLLSLVAHHQLRMHEKVLRRARPLHSIPPGSPMGWAYQIWQQCSRRAPSRDLCQALSGEMRGRYVWIDALGGKGELIMTEVGGGFPRAVSAALNPAVGSRIEDLPDDAFGRYCAEAYGAIAGTGTPALEDVDAIMTPPEGEPVRRRYCRLILPFRSRAGHARLLGLSFENLAIDLRRAS